LRSSFSAGAIPPRAPEHGPDAGGQFVWGEGFCHVVVEPGLQPLDDVVLALARGEHYDREGSKIGVLAPPDTPDEFEAVRTGHQAIRDEEVGDVPSLEQVQSLLAVRDLGNFVAESGELRYHDAPYDAVVVGYQYLRVTRIQGLIASLSIYVLTGQRRLEIIVPETEGFVT
jgi:hypothetical protein